MKTISFFLVGMTWVSISWAQTFQKKLSWKDNSFSIVSAEWVDLNNDSLLDVVLVGKDLNSNLKILTYKNSAKQSFVMQSSINENYSLSDFTLADINNDNRIDIVVSGSVNGKSSILSFINKGNFVFVKSQLSAPTSTASNIQFADLDQDGKEDLVLSGPSGIKIFKNGLTGFEVKFDSTQISVQGVSIRDFNSDGKNDVVISGNGSTGTPFLTLFKNNGKFKFEKIKIAGPVSGTITSGDFNHDGQFDIAVSGKNSQSLSQITLYQKSFPSFTATDSLPGFANANLLLADFNSDGRADLSFNGIDVNGNRYNLIKDYHGSLTTLDTTNLAQQRWGDFDRDGDLDIVQVLDSASFHVFKLQENMTSAVNKIPGVPSLGLAISLFDKTIVYWRNASDDHTPSPALTYDLLLIKNGSPDEVVSPEFDIASRRRILVSHGKQGTNTFAIINSLADDRYSYLVQTIDNAFNGSKCSGGDVLPCFDLKHEQLQACKNDSVTLKSSANAYWFSTSQGFLVEATSYTFVALKNDTIFSLVPQGADCSKNNIWTINVNDNSKSEHATKYVCENVSFKLGIAPGWTQVTWKTDQKTYTGDSIVLKVDKSATVTVTASNGTGCSYKKDFQINISKPDLILNGEVFRIKQGESVALIASGMKSYHWSPPDKLSSVSISSPIASPSKTTQYTMTGIDSVGCTASASVVVEVEETAFVPTLFTPNADGKNDDLRIYGLTGPAEFHFSIFTREGSLVYEVSDWTQAAGNGWNGSHNGVMQPPGLYYWKVEGKLSDGEPLKLNGKTKGSVLLVR